MTPLRNKMIEAMTVRGFSPRTHKSYLQAVKSLAVHYHQSPANLTPEQIESYFIYLATERGLAWSSCRLALNGIRFLYLQVLQWPGFDEIKITTPKRKQRIPELLNHTEVAAILHACDNLKHHMMLGTCYGCGLRVNELTHIKVSDIDGVRCQLRIDQGKGAKDRLMPLGPTLLDQLRHYWKHYHPTHWLFPSKLLEMPLSSSAIQRAFGKAKQQAGIKKQGGIHSLRHAYATHQLEAGMPVHRLQRLLGHQDLHSTLRYVHWAPSSGEGDGVHDLVANLEVRHD
ncbi:MAG: tyrosine-type recombinase/integrase [Gammaproteobacteria bacterium]|nr:tyrosine-type recombinase/integrase [Gammaproteobacteria bacterium]MCP4994406.1 tyrosine-type recombinase/integrase [Gammaproteobacteria bacterium]